MQLGIDCSLFNWKLQIYGYTSSNKYQKLVTSYRIKLKLLPDQIMKASGLQFSNLVGRLVITKDKPYHKHYLIKKMFK